MKIETSTHKKSIGLGGYLSMLIKFAGVLFAIIEVLEFAQEKLVPEYKKLKNQENDVTE